MVLAMNTAVIKRSVIIDGRKTSISLENEFWDALRGIASARNISVTLLVEQIERDRKTVNLSSAIRTFIFSNLRKDTDTLGAGRQFPDSQNLRARGEELRVLAKRTTDGEMRVTLLRIAEDYERVADRLEVVASISD
jgi:predicted DNA-binding ribbon-helix-helix protein